MGEPCNEDAAESHPIIESLIDHKENDRQCHEPSDHYKNSKLYMDKIILAPMVRMNSLAFRLLALEYGADLVYSEECIDHRIIKCKRIVNRDTGTIDFVDNNNKLVFQTCELERNKVILQIGSNNPERALQAAKIFSNDVAAIDFNFGCPQSFSLKGGMGAALLSEPEKIKALLTTMVNQIQKPVTCKIRVLPDLNDTIHLAKMIEECGVSAIAVHGRTKREKTKHKNRNDFIREITKALRIPVIASGGSTDIKCYNDIIKFKETTQASSVMIARAAMQNASIFRKTDVPLPIETVIKRYLTLSMLYTEHFANTKWSVQMMLGSLLNSERGAKILGTRKLDELYELFGVFPSLKGSPEHKRMKLDHVEFKEE